MIMNALVELLSQKLLPGRFLLIIKAADFLQEEIQVHLMVQDVTTNPKAVGLLFAGSSSIAVANPIGDVLGFLGASKW
jgi:hypothetical protein